MKNKRLVYLLLPLAVVLWGMIGFRIWKAIEHDDHVESNGSENITAISPVSKQTKEPPKLRLSYHDPFTSHQLQEAKEKSGSVSKRSAITSDSKRVFAIKPLKQEVVWPLVEYHGMVENRNKRSMVAMIRINGSDFLAKEGDVVSGVKIKKVLSDSVLLVKYKNIKYVRFLSSQ